PDKNVKNLGTLASIAERAGTSAIMIGGSIGVSEKMLDRVILSLKRKIRIPIILFPGNITGISKYADAIWFMSLLNSSNTYYLIDAQALGAIIVKKYGIEAIPMGYLIIGEGGVAGYIGQARIIPYDHPEVAAIYALAGQLLGMRFIYLEAGSGAKKPIPQHLIKYVRKIVSIPIIVGGGIRTRQQAKEAILAGADILVTGTIIEEENAEKRINEIIRGIREAVQERR
ncbi:MAG: geranylgeranylglyceryl/heptaprenylglyceryl phosphate synthase, partial [archaeon GB-1867-035]|nr:geranylgeranylglyceryl/heptaprenylglyceryl phosphate synthase [Candidatus Culexmicrobium profundum]